MNDPERFAALIAGLQSAGMSRTEIALRAGLSRNTVWRLATGDARLPSYATIDRLERLSSKIVVRPLEQKRR